MKADPGRFLTGLPRHPNHFYTRLPFEVVPLFFSFAVLGLVANFIVLATLCAQHLGYDPFVKLQKWKAHKVEQRKKERRKKWKGKGKAKEEEIEMTDMAMENIKSDECSKCKGKEKAKEEETNMTDTAVGHIKCDGCNKYKGEEEEKEKAEEQQDCSQRPGSSLGG